MKVKVSVKTNSAKLRRIASDHRVGMFMSQEAQKGMDEFVPYLDGPLSTNVTAEPFLVTYEMRYAKFPYHGTHMNFTRDTHPNATSYWDRAWKNKGLGGFTQSVESFIKGL